MTYTDKIAELYDRLKEKQLKKNHDYGDSIFKNGKFLGVTLDRESGVLYRLSDKFKRLESQELQTLSESKIDTLHDIVGYFMTWIIMEEEKVNNEVYKRD